MKLANGYCPTHGVYTDVCVECARSGKVTTPDKKHVTNYEGNCVTKDCERGCDRKLRRVGDLLFSEESTYVTDASGGRKGTKPVRFDLLAPESLAELASVAGLGAEEYPETDDGTQNWELGYSWRLSFAALCRHLWRWFMGETFDPKSKCHHLAHAMWHAMVLIAFEARGLGTDDRPKVKR